MNISEPRACPICECKLFVLFYVDPKETFTRCFDGWECPKCGSRFPKKSWDLLELMPNEWEDPDGYLDLDEEEDSSMTQAEPSELCIGSSGQPMRRIKSISELE